MMLTSLTAVQGGNKWCRDLKKSQRSLTRISFSSNSLPEKVGDGEHEKTLKMCSVSISLVPIVRLSLLGANFLILFHSSTERNLGDERKWSWVLALSSSFLVFNVFQSMLVGTTHTSYCCPKRAPSSYLGLCRLS